MKPNPDEFIFHSKFDYNVPAIQGYKDFASSPVPIPATIELASGIQAGDRFKVVDEFNNTVYSRGGPFSGALVTYYTQNGKLYAQMGAQGAGQTYSGRLHYRVYRKSKDFSFTSKTKIEKVVFTAEGTFTAGYYVNTQIPNTYGKKLLLTAVWRELPNGNWNADGYSGANNGSLGLTNTDSNVSIVFGNGNGAANTVEYKIVGTALYGT